MTTQRRNLALERLLATMLESPDRGAGVPSHTAEEGRLYWDKTNDDLYGNSDGSTTWQLIGGGSPETFLDFEEIAEPAAPDADHLRLFAVDDSGVTTLETKDSDGHVFRVHEDIFRVARNNTGSQIDKGDVVYFAGSTGNKPNIALARADDESTMPAIGVAAENIANTDFGIISVIGRIESIDTSAFNEGDILYVSPTVAGGLTATRPTHPNFAQFIGTVEVSGVGNGAILLNTEPTLLGRDSGTILDNFTIGDETGGAKTLTFDNGNEAVLSWEPTTARTVTIPDETMTLAGRNVENVFTAAQTIQMTDNKKLSLVDTAGATLALYAGAVGGQVVSDGTLKFAVNSDLDTAAPSGLAATIETNGHLLINTISDAAQLTVKADGASTVGLMVDTASAPSAQATIWRNNGTNAAQVDTRNTLSNIGLLNFDLGNNNPGPTLFVYRNTNSGTEGPVAGALQLRQANNTIQNFWVDNTGNFRIHTSRPTGSAGSPTVADSAGSIVGDQTSWHELKQNIQPWHAQSDALQTVLGTPLYEFELKADSQLCHDSSKKRRYGLIIEDRTEWFAHNCGPQQIPALDERTLFGHLIASIQALHGRIETLEAQLGTA